MIDMTPEERRLLLKDLSARLPYNVVIRCTDSDTDYKCFLTTDILIELQNNTMYFDYKPYLRPMSSMTEEEEDEYDSMFSNARRIYCNCVYYDTVQEDDVPDFIDWLLEHHFDYRGLIPMGLALEAPSDMYKTE